MSSHREAPEISKDPVADNTDVYAFVSPDKPDTVTIIANFIPFQNPYGGPNFYEFGDDVLYQLHISNSGTGRADISYQFRFQAKIRNKKTFLYNTGPITSLKDPNWNRPQFYSVTRVENGRSRILARDLAAPPVNVGVRSTPNYAKLARSGDPHHRPQPPGLRRSARRRVLRRPRQHLRPRHAAAVPDGPPDPVRRRDGRQRAAGIQRAHDRAPGPDQRPDPRRQHSQGRAGPEVRHRRLRHREPPAVPDPRRPGWRPDLARPVQAGLAAGQPAVQRGHRADGREGQVEQPAPPRTTRPSPSTSPSRSSPDCCRCSTRVCSRGWRRTRSPGPIWPRSC